MAVSLVKNMNFEVIYYRQPRLSDPITENHRYSENWDRTEFYCLNCGVRDTVWQSAAEDIDAGPTLMCTQCGFHHCFGYSGIAKESSPTINNQDWQRLQALRRGV